MAPHASNAEELDSLLVALCDNKQLSDERYAQMRTHVLSRKYGASRIRYELKAKGIEGELAERIVGESSASEVERARAAWQRKFRSPPQSREDRAKHSRFLQSRGFSFDVIKSVLSSEQE